jgi:nitroreductase
MIRDLVAKNRSYRRFHQERALDIATLKELVDLGRISSSAANLQPLKYILSCDTEKNALIFSHLAWAAYLKDWPGPAEGERPSAYIVMLGDTTISQSFGCDQGLAAQSILLGAVEKGLGGCIIGLVDREGLRYKLNIPAQYEVLVVIALGEPKESVTLESLGEDGDVRYWRDAEGGHHVPKRALNDIILG